jgi:arylsulfatase A-like enzyme
MTTETQDRPNILLIFTDQHRLSAVSAYGETPCRTPNIDRLAREGVRFERAYTVFPVCSPARGTIQTGLYPHGHGVTANIHEVGCSVHELQDHPTRLPRRLQDAGYSTGYTGKWHLGTERQTTFHGPNHPSLPSDLGYEGQDFPGHGGAGYGYAAYQTWLREHGWALEVAPWAEETRQIRGGIAELAMPTAATVPAYLVDRTLGLIQTFRERRRPFFMSLNFWGPHGPYHATREFLDLYRDVEIPPWPNYAWDARDTAGPHHLKIHWADEAYTWEDWAMAVRYYYARVSMIDSQIGRLIDHLRETGLLEETVVILTADHGQTLGSHGGLLDKGWHHFEEIQRIPMIVRMPAGSGGVVRGEFVSLADVYPTLLELAGAEAPDYRMHGRSLVPLLRGESVPWRDAVVTEFLGLGNVGTCMKTVRVGDLKYGYNGPFPGELYDLASDPHEMQNVIDDPAYADDLRRLQHRLETWMVDTEDPALRMYRWQLGQTPT